METPKVYSVVIVRFSKSSLGFRIPEDMAKAYQITPNQKLDFQITKIFRNDKTIETEIIIRGQNVNQSGGSGSIIVPKPFVSALKLDVDDLINILVL